MATNAPAGDRHQNGVVRVHDQRTAYVRSVVAQANAQFDAKSLRLKELRLAKAGQPRAAIPQEKKP